MSHSHPRIFVQIPAYRDPECQHTVRDLFAKAAEPERVTVGICWQVDETEDQHCFEVPYERPEQVRESHHHYSESNGVCWARDIAQSLRQDEEYTLQIDSHMRFEQDWDRLLLDMLAQCQGERNLLSHYAPSFIPPDTYNRDITTYLYPARINDEGIPMEQSLTVTLNQAPPRPVINYSIAGGLLFAPSRLFEEVPYDPHIYFWGEQAGMAARAWTHGWNIYSPQHPTVYHIYHVTKTRPLNWDDNPEWTERRKRSTARMHYLLGMAKTIEPGYAQDIEQFGLGSARELAEYQELLGIDFAARRISPQMASRCTTRLEQAGAKLTDDTKDWYQHCFVTLQIRYNNDDDMTLQLAETYHNGTHAPKNRQYEVALLMAARFFHAKQQEEAQNWAYKALALDSSKPHAYCLLATNYMRQHHYLNALPLLSAAVESIGDAPFTPCYDRQQHPLVLLATCYCKAGQPEKARHYAEQALAQKLEPLEAMQAIANDAENSIDKDFWLFKDKELTFKQYNQLNAISPEWENWARTNAKSGISPDYLQNRLREIGFKAALVETLMHDIKTA